MAGERTRGAKSPLCGPTGRPGPRPRVAHGLGFGSGRASVIYPLRDCPPYRGHGSRRLLWSPPADAPAADAPPPSDRMNTGPATDSGEEREKQ